MTDLALPRLELPPGALVYHEEVAADPFERRGSKRFAILAGGEFVHQANKPDWDAPGALADAGDPAAFWQAPLELTPLATLSEDELRRLREAIREAAIDEIRQEPPERLAGRRNTNPVLERWTVQRDGTASTLVHHRGDAPKRVARLRETVDELVGAALARR